MADQDPSPKSGKQQARPEFEVAYFTKELGRPLQRKMLARQLAGLTDDAVASHGEDPMPQGEGTPPREDRAG
jgi:hypothetical protein